MKDITLTHTNINSFMGIDQSAPMVFDFTKAFPKGKNITTLQGNQGTNKTSTITALMFLLGANFDFDKDNLINLKDGTINLDQEFEVDGETYRVKATKSRFELERYVPSENPKKEGKWYREDEPKTTLQRLVGTLGVSPMFLKSMTGEKQIDWFRRQFAGGDDKAVAKEQSLKKKLKELTTARRAVNGDYTRIKKALEINPLYANKEENYKKFEKPVDAESEKKKVQELQSQADEYNRKEIALNNISSNLIPAAESNLQRMERELLEEIERRKAEIAKEKEKLENLRDQKKKGDEYIAENATIKRDYEEAQEAFMNLNEVIREQIQWYEVLKMEKEMDEYQDEIVKADDMKKKLSDDLMKLTKKYLPEIPGLEIKINTGLDDEPEGIFYQGKTLAQLSESELWALFFQIWEQKDVMFVFVENVQDLGTQAIQILNEMVKKGVKVFATMMDRKKDKVKVSFIDELN